MKMALGYKSKFVIFGCDNTGKTTLCNNLRDYLIEQYNVEIAKSIGANKTIYEYMEFMKTNIEKENIVIFDRFPIIEEATCGKVLRDINIFGKWDNIGTIEILESIDVYIFCYPGLFSVLNWGSREQMDGIKENVLPLINAYNEVAVALKSIGLNVFEYNYKMDNVFKFYCKMKSELERS